MVTTAPKSQLLKGKPKTEAKPGAKARKAPAKRAVKSKAASQQLGKAGPSDTSTVKAGQAKLRKAHDRLLKASESNEHQVTIVNLLGLNPKIAAQLPSAVTKGLPVSTLDNLAKGFEVSVRELTERLIGISRQTLNRRRQAGVLTPPESDAAVRYARLREQASAMMEGDEDAALRWLKSPLPILGGESPLDHSRTETGGREVELLIGRIEHGVYS